MYPHGEVRGRRSFCWPYPVRGLSESSEEEPGARGGTVRCLREVRNQVQCVNNFPKYGVRARGRGV